MSLNAHVIYEPNSDSLVLNFQHGIRRRSQEATFIDRPDVAPPLDSATRRKDNDYPIEADQWWIMIADRVQRKAVLMADGEVA